MARRPTTPLALTLAISLAALAACNSDSAVDPGTAFLSGTSSNPEIGLVINTTGRALTMFQLGKPSEQRQIPLGASSTVTPTGLALRSTHALVPLGDAASVALIDLAGQRIQRFFTFPSGNATGAGWVDDTTFVAANFLDDYLAKGTFGQASGALTTKVDVAPAPTAVVMTSGFAFVISSNLNESYVSIGNGVVTKVNPSTMAVVGHVETGATNATAGAVGPDGKLYVLNTDDFVNDASITIIDPTTLAVETTITGFPVGAGSIRIDANGLAYISSYATGTVIWNTGTRTFVRDLAHPVCAGNPCRGAFDANRAADGSVYQTFLGDASHTPDPYPPYVFVYAPNTYELVDSIAVGPGPISVDIARFH